MLSCSSMTVRYSRTIRRGRLALLSPTLLVCSCSFLRRVADVAHYCICHTFCVLCVYVSVCWSHREVYKNGRNDLYCVGWGVKLYSNSNSNCIKTAELMPFVMWTLVSQRNHVLGGCLGPPGEEAFAEISQPIVSNKCI